MHHHVDTAYDDQQQTFLHPTVVFAPEVQDTVLDDVEGGGGSFSFDFSNEVGEGACAWPSLVIVCGCVLRALFVFRWRRASVQTCRLSNDKASVFVGPRKRNNEALSKGRGLGVREREGMPCRRMD